MTKETYEKARDIQNKLDDLNKLYYIACQPYKKYFLTKKFLWITPHKQDEVCLCDGGLTEVIREYCSKRMKELREELKNL